jgi:radical SAM superfamily enzyme YgiQ (UPF0313 family)
MSGVRAHDPELLRLGLTLPGFVERSKTVAQLPSLGLLYLAACTPSGHRLRYYEAESDGSEPAEIYQCDLVAISTFSAQVFEAYAIADRLRAVGVKVAMGGLHGSVQPDEAALHADYVIIGEGETIWPDVVAAAENHEMPKPFTSTQLVDVNELPIPRYDLLNNQAGREYNRFTVQTSRGCPGHCEFCASTIRLGHRYRKRPVEHVIRDIEAIADLRRRPFIEFADDNTFVDKEWGRELCRQLIPLKLRWFTETDISVAQDAELLELMRQAGCRQVLIGLESPSSEALDGLELRANFKARSAHRYAAAIAEIQSHGITVNGCFILGLDSHTPGIFQDVLDSARETHLFDVQITVLTAFPGTPFYNRMLKANRILEPNRWDLCTLFDVNHQPGNMSPEELREGMRWLTTKLYNDECTDYRRAPFFKNLSRRQIA